jgi:hypothetical protein
MKLRTIGIRLFLQYPAPAPETIYLYNRSKSIFTYTFASKRSAMTELETTRKADSRQSIDYEVAQDSVMSDSL